MTSLTAPAARPDGAVSFYRTYMTVLLTAAYGLNLLDRQIVTVLAEPIKRDLHLMDWQLGAVTGLAFALLYSVAALPIARLADRGDRVRIVGAAILAWSLFTGLCAFASGFLQLLLLRVGVGVGEAGCAPPAQSLIADHYPPERRAGALGVFALGSPLGAAVGLAVGGVLGQSLGWRGTLMAAAAPGLLIAFLVLTTLREPRKSGLARIEPSTQPAWRVVRGLLGRPSFVWLALGAGLLGFVNNGAMAFAAPFYLRVHGREIAQFGAPLHLGALAVIGIGMGLFGALAGGAGAYVGGLLGDRMAARDVRALAFIPAAGSLLTAVAYWGMFTAPSGLWSLALFMPPSFFANLWNGPATHAMQDLAGPAARATALALVLFVISALGLGLGPITVGAISDHLAPSLGAARGLQLAILAGVSVALLSALCHLLAGRTLAADLSRRAEPQPIA